jgi:hypothetical protein
MKKTMFVFLMALSFNSFAQNQVILCADTRNSAVTHAKRFTNFSENFYKEHLTNKALQRLKDEGYNHFVGGLCGIIVGHDTFDTQVFIAFEDKAPLEIDLGKFFNWYKARIEVSNLSLNEIMNGVELNGDSKDLLQGDNNTSANLITNRGQGKVKIIIRGGKFINNGDRYIMRDYRLN